MADVKVRQSKEWSPTQARQDQAETLDRAIPFPWRSGKLIKDITMVPGTDRRISHGLKRRHQGWVLVRPRKGNGAHVIEVSEAASTTTFTLSATGPITFDLWVW